MSESLGPTLRARRATPDDLGILVEFNAAMARETEGKDLDRDRLQAGVAAVLREGDLGFYLVAESAETVVGQLLVTFEWSDWRNGYFWWIQSVYVAPGYRRRGVYRMLENRVRDEARGRGDVCGLRLYVARGNLIAQRVYANLGMRRSHYDMFEVDLTP
jgi:GNAT superfamily N-acetyltransferase